MNSECNTGWHHTGRNRPNRGGFGRGSWRRPAQYNRDPNYGGNRFGNYQNFPNNQYQWKQRDSPGKRLSEPAIGVTKYLNSHPGFSGIIKSRYSDFQVSEINLQGEIAVLTDESPPQPPETKKTVQEDEDLVLCKYNLEILPMETWDQINQLAVSTENTNEKVEIDATGITKEQRTKIHDAVKKAFGSSIVGKTVTVGDKKVVCFEKYRKGVRIDTRVKWIWPGDFVHFIVHKENCDTMDAAFRIADRLRLNIKPSMLGYAGTKDRRAKTSQWFSLKRVDPRRIASACASLRDVRVGNYSLSDTHLRLGQLQGNRFRIALRNVTSPDEVVNEACELLRDKGFINYYGLQRFGTRAESPTYDIGLELLRANYRQAIDRILYEREGPLQNAMHRYRSEGPAAALRALPPRMPRCDIETRLLKALARHPNDLQGAINKLARNTRLLYLHSYQSLVWNRCVSERLARYGAGPAVGDLVPAAARLADTDSADCADHAGHEEILEDEDEESDSEGQNDADPVQGAEKDEQTDKSETADAAAQDSDKDKHKLIDVKALTQEEVDSGQYTIFDIVMPLPGQSVQYPPNMKDFYEQLLTKDGLTLDMKHKVKSYCMSGAYRRMVCAARDLRWRGVRYSRPSADLQLSDGDRLDGLRLDGLRDDGKYKAVLLTMTLPASCYATMALRELLKADTSGDSQAQLNNYHKEPAGTEPGSGAGTEPGPGTEGDTEATGPDSSDQQHDKRKISDDGDSEDADGQSDAKKSKQDDQ